MLHNQKILGKIHTESTSFYRNESHVKVSTTQRNTAHDYIAIKTFRTSEKFLETEMFKTNLSKQDLIEKRSIYIRGVKKSDA